MIAVEIQVSGAEQLQAAFVQVERETEHLESVFEAIAPEVFDDIRRRIDNHPGPPLAASTVKRKGNTRILRDQDDLYGTFQKGAAGNITRISPTSAEFGTADMKAMFHQTGTSRMPKRTIIEVTGEQDAKYARIAADKLGERMKSLGFEVT